ncbi:DUF3108 domain-containing protein [Kordia zhangzhouensis]|uniref:DUF3108 domain-containing protein n=1 Tax=Kordia zhangzhouensis TaxID=1620405 RepID=UPI00062997E9|nr:DUF3108 domain-containing protein [Kordia zhangzhouensis]
MKRILSILILLVSFILQAQNKDTAFQSGEWFKFRIHYGFINASYATLEVKDEYLNGKNVYHVIGKGQTTGFASWFFKVDDNYESYFDKETGRPYKFIRQIDEGGHTKDIEIDFNHEREKALVNNKKHKTKKEYNIEKDVQDMVSAFYYLRNNYDVSNIKEGDEIILNMFFDKENFKFKLKFLGREIMRTKFGKVPCLKFRPYVQAGRVFKENESLTLWVSDDENKIPIRIKAKLMVGSLKADLDAFKGLKHPFKIVVD